VIDTHYKVLGGGGENRVAWSRDFVVAARLLRDWAAFAILRSSLHHLGARTTASPFIPHSHSRANPHLVYAKLSLKQKTKLLTALASLVMT
jgi:hypothetical protein